MIFQEEEDEEKIANYMNTQKFNNEKRRKMSLYLFYPGMNVTYNLEFFFCFSDAHNLINILPFFRGYSKINYFLQQVNYTHT